MNGLELTLGALLLAAMSHRLDHCPCIALTLYGGAVVLVALSLL